MKFVVLSSLVAWVLFLMLQSSANGAKDPFSVVVVAQWPSEKVGSDLTVLATITNTSSKKITINDRQPYCDYRIDIHDEVGNVPPTDKWRKEVNWGDSSGFELSGRNIPHELAPAKSYKDRLDLKQWFVISHPGKYTWQRVGRVQHDNSNCHGAVRMKAFQGCTA
jgi:hypothetical protein